MQKLIGAGLIVAAFFTIGYLKSYELKKRRDSLRSIISDFEILTAEISFSKNTLTESFRKIEVHGKTGIIFFEAAENIGQYGIGHAWKKSINDNAGNLGFSKEDAEVLLSAGNRIGKTDMENQIAYLKNTIELLKIQEQSANEEYNKLARLYQTGCLLIGALIALLLM